MISLSGPGNGRQMFQGSIFMSNQGDARKLKDIIPHYITDDDNVFIDHAKSVEFNYPSHSQRGNPHPKKAVNQQIPTLTVTLAQA
jgi:hypothetical protein